MTFEDLPKQWLIARQMPASVQGVSHAGFQGWHIQTAQHVPVLTLQDATGTDLGRVIGWAAFDGRFYREDTTVTLPDGDTPETVYARMSGRFVIFWQSAEGRMLLREDGSGLLPAIYAPGLEAMGSTITALEMLGPLTPDPQVMAIYDFPKRKGFLPFGLTPCSDAHRLMPNHTLDVSSFSAKRSWPDAEYCTRKPISAEVCRDRAAQCSAVMQAYLKALIDAQGETVLYLSAGYDSRSVLAAAVQGGLEKSMVFHSLVDNDGGGLDALVAAKFAKRLGRPHTFIEIGKTPPDEVRAWIKRTGDMVFDTVTEISGTMKTKAPDNHPLSGTGADIMKAGNWNQGDAERETIDTTGILNRLRLMDVPPIRQAAEAWMASIPDTADAAIRIDLSTIEQRHACWSGAAIYGLPVALPTLHPFAGHMLNSLVLDLPRNYRVNKEFFNDYIDKSTPWLNETPVNRPEGLNRLRFWKQELRRLTPKKIKRLIKPY